MATNSENLREHLLLVLDEINLQTGVIAIEAKAREVSPFAMRTRTGSWVMTDLLAAKAQTLHALVLLEAGK